MENIACAAKNVTRRLENTNKKESWMSDRTIVLIVLTAMTLVFVGAALAKPDPADIKTKKPTHDIILILDEAHEYEEYIMCPDCGLTHYMHIKMTEAFDERVVTITLWYDRSRTEQIRRRILGNNNPFDIFDGLGARGWPE